MRIGQPRRFVGARETMNESVSSTSNPTPKTPVSERKVSANRANAQRSTGPRTPQGKARSSLNALRHGILARAAFNLKIEGVEKRAEFDAIVAGLAQEFQPQTTSEHLMVQQLAGCYWRMAKVWTLETESAWRWKTAHFYGIDTFNELEKAWFGKMMDSVIEEQCKLFPKAGLGRATIPGGASANTILRYQSAINSMLFRTQGILERRRKERMAEQKSSGEACDERDYINEATEVAAEEEAASEAASKSAKEADLHKRTKKTRRMLRFPRTRKRSPAWRSLR